MGLVLSPAIEICCCSFPCLHIVHLTGLLIFRGKKSKILRDFQGQIRGKINRFRGIWREKRQNSQKIGRFRGILAEKSQISKDFQGQILRKIGRNFRGELRQETISKKQPISLDFFWQISLKIDQFCVNMTSVV